ncbi:MAG: lipoprotein signal peptidase [Zoogloeaceae bacterium]|nr:lipoprotein signal peptidase [Zoogloeaceae bacterium]
MTGRFFAWLSVIAVVAVLDQISKIAVLARFRYGESRPVTDFFDLVLVFNPGAAFSFMADHSGWQRWFFIVLATGVSAWLTVMIWRHQTERAQPLAFALIVGGALGNVIDRFRFGAVVDFLYFHVGPYGWPAFNLADSAITLGVMVLLGAQIHASRTASAEEKLS